MGAVALSKAGRRWLVGQPLFASVDSLSGVFLLFTDKTSFLFLRCHWRLGIFDSSKSLTTRSDTVHSDLEPFVETFGNTLLTSIPAPPSVTD
jgi:hypothetical protein